MDRPQAARAVATAAIQTSRGGEPHAIERTRSITFLEARWSWGQGHPVFHDRALSGITNADRSTLERVALEAIPVLRGAS